MVLSKEISLRDHCGNSIEGIIGQHQTTEDPHREISLMYLNSRARLEERIGRLRSGLAAAALVLPRTAHALSNLSVEEDGTDAAKARCVCVTHIYDPKHKIEHRTVARYEIGLVRSGRSWKIRTKTAVVLNDNLPTRLEFFML